MSPDPFMASLAREALETGAWSLRLVPVAALCPFLGGPLLPPAARAALALAVGAAARAGMGGHAFPARDPVALVGTELALGTVLAVAASIPVEAARGAGRLVDTLRGATLGELHVAPIRQRETAVGDLLSWWTVAVGAWAGADRLLVAALLETYRAVPVGAALDAPLHATRALDAAASLLGSALLVGGPAAAAILAADLALSVASRIAPRLALGEAALAARATLGLLAVAVAGAAVGGRLAELAAAAGGLVRAALGGAP